MKPTDKSKPIFELSDLSLDRGSYDSKYLRVKASITNNGTQTYYYIKLKATLYDKYENVIDTNWTYAVASEGLRIGETKKFDVMMEKDDRLDSYGWSVIGYK